MTIQLCCAVNFLSDHNLRANLISDCHSRSHSFNVHTPLKKEKIQDPPIEHDLYVTLEEINTGCVKKMKISRRVLPTPDGPPKKEDKYVSISIKPGWKSGTKVTFQKEGDQAKGRIPADIVFLIRDKPHPLFRREGSDLRYTARLTLKQVSSSGWSLIKWLISLVNLFVPCQFHKLQMFLSRCCLIKTRGYISIVRSQQKCQPC